MEMSYSNSKKNVGAGGMSTLIPISEGLDPSIFRRKMEKMHFMREEMDGKVFFSWQSRHFNL